MRTETGVNVLAVRRNKRTLDTNPGGDFIIERGDELVCLGTPEQLSSMARLADDGRRRLQLAS